MNKIAVAIKCLYAIASLLFLSMSIQNTSFGQQFEAEGTITYSTEFRLPQGQGTKRIQITKAFTVYRREDQWRIRTIDIDQNKSASPSVLFEEIGYDGTNIYELRQNDKNKSFLLTKRKDSFTAIGRVQETNSPLCLQPNLIYPLWLAYCSSSYFRELRGSRVVAPLFIPEDFFTTAPPKRIELRAEWKMNKYLFINNISWFSEGTFVVSENGKEKLEKYPPPYDSGFLNATFETTDWTNAQELTLPNSFALTVFSPNALAQEVTNLDVSFTIVGNTETVRPLRDFYWQPLLTSKTLITDTRVYRGHFPVSYSSSSNWDTEEDVKLNLRNVDSGLAPSQNTSINKGPIVLLILVAVTAMFITTFRLMKT